MNGDAENLDEARYRSLLRWREWWTILVFALGLAATAFLIMAIALFVGESWIPGAVSTLASILSGGAVRWLLARRREAVNEEELARERRYEEIAEKTNAEQEKAKAEQDWIRREQSRGPLFPRGK
jgi:hypothetical protein